MLSFSFFFATVFSFFTNTSYAGEMHVCPGSGESCVAEITWGGEKIKVNSYKSKGLGTIVVQ
jgi:hypothetical protein